MHLKCLTTLLGVFLMHLSYCRRKAFNDALDNINELLNFKCNLVSRLSKLEDTAADLGLKDTFLRTLNSLL